MTRKWNLPLTYAPKIPAVLDGRCTQTIRARRKFKLGDLISFHGWSGKPYRSTWSFRTPYYEVILAEPIVIHTSGIFWEWNKAFWEWESPTLDALAEYDHINPPIGVELGNVLLSMHKIPAEGLEAQIIRWGWEG